MKSVAVVTGGTSGIGLEVAKAFARNGLEVAICGRNAERLAAAAAAISESVGPDQSDFSECLPIQVDLTGDEGPLQVAKAVADRYGRIDVLVNAAGLAINKPFGETSREEFEATVAINMRAVYFLTQAFWPMMTEQRSGVIVNISSLAAVSPFPGFSAYGSSKAWVDLFTLALANEGAANNIRAFTVRPGAVETPMLRGLFPDFPAEQTVEAANIADVVVALTEPPFQFSSGQAINVTRQQG